MNAERFCGDADSPGLVVCQAHDRTLLPNCRGWTCGRCETTWAFEREAEGCCAGPVTAEREAAHADDGKR